MSTLPTIWYFVLLAIVLLFVVLDGPDLGVGVLSLMKGRTVRSEMLDSIGPTWYASETWLVIAGGLLFAAFPSAYSLVLSTLYVPVIVLLFGLIFRSVATSQRGHGSNETFWDLSLGIGCLLAGIGLGLLLGGLLGRMSVWGSDFAAGYGQWLNPVSILIAIAAISGTAMLGAARLTSDGSPDHTRDFRRLLQGSASLTLAISLALAVVLTLQGQSNSADWLQTPRLFIVAGFAVVALAGLLMLAINAWMDKQGRLSYGNAVAIVVGIAAMVTAAIYPYVVPFSITIDGGASPTSSLMAMVFGAGVVLPVVIAYNIYVRVVLRRR